MIHTNIHANCEVFYLLKEQKPATIFDTKLRIPQNGLQNQFTQSKQKIKHWGVFIAL